MSNKFIWVRNPTIINGLATTYVSKRGSDVTGNGTAQNPYASIAKATSVATANTNIMLDDGEWNEARTENGRIFNWWGNGKTKISTQNIFVNTNSTPKIYPANANYLYLYNILIVNTFTFNNCFLDTISFGNIWTAIFNNCVLYNVGRPIYTCLSFRDSVVVRTSNLIYPLEYASYEIGYTKNSIFINCSISTNAIYNKCINCNFTNNNLPQNSLNCINNEITGQSFADYFNHYDANDWLKCDFTAKDGSKNIGAGEKGCTIGLNQGFAARADGTANDVFSSANSATLRNVAFDSNLGGYVLQQKDRFCSGATANTITFDNDASSENDYYKGLFVGITAGVGETQIRYITSYNGATRTATVNTNWETIPDTESEYSISGKIDSVVKDFGKAIKVKRNFTFVDNMTALANGQWEEFLTAVNAEDEMIPASCYSYEYSVDGVTWRSSTELVSATDGTNYVDAFTIGDASEQFNEEIAEFLVFRYIRFHIHIGFNIDVFAEE